MDGKVDQAKGHIKGVMDLQAAIASPEADAVRAAMAQLPPDQVQGFMESLSFYGLYAHGTHVAGIAVGRQPLREAALRAHHLRLPHAPAGR